MALTKKAPAGAKVFDLPAARSARAEARKGEPAVVLKLSAGYVEIKPELDLMTVEDLLQGQFKSALVRLFVDPADADALLNEGISDDDLAAIFEFAAGKPLGEVPA